MLQQMLGGKFACAPFCLRVLCAGVKSLNLLLCVYVLVAGAAGSEDQVVAQRCHKLILQQVPLCLGRKSLLSLARNKAEGNNTQSTGGIQSAKLTGPELLCPPL